MRTPPLPRRPVDASARPSQLDIIAGVNADAARQHRGRLALYAAGASAAVLLGAALWWLMQGRTLQAPATPVGSAAVGHSPSVARAAAEPAEPGPATAPAQSEPEAQAATEVTAASAPASDDRARKARARRESEVRSAGELQLAQLRLQLEAQDRQQREAEREAQQVRELVDAAGRRAAAQAPARAQPTGEPERGIRERCLASGNVVSEFLCHSRECRKPEHASDSLCTRLREIDEARRHSGQ